MNKFLYILKRQMQSIMNSQAQSPWKSILTGAEDVLQSPSTGRRVLLATSLGAYNHGIIVESSLAAALSLRGASTDVFLCDGILSACQLSKYAKIGPREFITRGQGRICRDCFAIGKRFFGPLGVRVHAMSEYLTEEDFVDAKAISQSISPGDIPNWRFRGMAVGEHAWAGALRYYARGDLNGEPEGAEILARYVEASVLVACATDRLLSSQIYDVACFHHGIYVPQGIIGEVCRNRGVRVVNWNPAYRKHCFIFSHGDSYHHTMISEPTASWDSLQWTHLLEDETKRYLKSRWQGTEDWIWFHEKPEYSWEKIVKELGLNVNKPAIGMLTNVMWDAQLHYKSNAFKNMLEWVTETIKYFAKRPDLQLLIRVHPAEIRGMVPSRQPLVEELKQIFGSFPANVFIIPPESPISTYAAMAACDSVLIYNTKTGIELTSVGIPVVVAGEAWIRGKGFSLDADSPKAYFEILDSLPLGERMKSGQVKKALMYAFHFFFRRMIPLPFIESPEQFTFELSLASIHDLARGRHLGLDVICDGILLGTPFIYPAEAVLREECLACSAKEA